MLVLEMIVFMVNMPLVSQRSLEDWEMISFITGLVIGMVMGNITPKTPDPIPLFSMEINLGLNRVLMAMMSSRTIEILLILTVYGGGGSDQLGGGRSWDNLMASSMLLDGGSGDDLVTGSNRYSDVRSKYTLSQYQSRVVCPVRLPNTR